MPPWTGANVEMHVMGGAPVLVAARAEAVMSMASPSCMWCWGWWDIIACCEQALVTQLEVAKVVNGRREGMRGLDSPYLLGGAAECDALDVGGDKVDV